MYHYTKEGARTLPVWRTSNIFIDFHCVCPFPRVSGVLAGHIEPCDPSSVQDKQKQAVLEFFFWICDYAGLLQLSCALWVSWQTGLLLRGGNLKATGRISEPLRMWLSENRMCLCPELFVPKVFREAQCRLLNITFVLSPPNGKRKWKSF